MNAPVVVVTGASRGLGRALALRLAARGADLALVARDAEALRQVGREVAERGGGQALLVPCDVADPGQVAAMARAVGERFGRVHALVNNAGIGVYKPLERMSHDDLRRHLEVNVLGPCLCIQALLPLLKQAGSGYVLNVGSAFGRASLAETSVYAASKAALARLSQGLDRELRVSGIRVGLFAPGAMATAFQDGREEQAVRAPKLFMVGVDTAARAMEKMLRTRARSRAMPWWLPHVLRLKLALG